ncbi:MAG: hypothetical protein IJH84_18125 [Saccharopolyspora sp.]|uniref:tetratricopeptide repeat protein n=1 Tax=Saccharopolyspora sp. TaxID=33915 RepID=UPI0025FB82EA|nr:tetratricopeptide repeat protein [Saccharopolyspora sp.]MBQ6642936.1 hypothetical protein [Saccharopolyspora sp.]
MGDPAWHNSNNSQVHGNFVQAGVINAERIIFGSSEHAGPAIPDTLPAKPTGFLDREHESGKLDELLRAAEAAGTQLLALLPGMQGVGKTTLAVHWGRSNKHLFPDGALFADLAASAPGGPAGADELLGGFLAQLGVPPAMTPVRTADRQAVFRNLTSGRRMLVVLDDAASTAQVTEVMPASERSCVLVTTRKTLGLDAVSVPVEPFGSEHAEALAGRDLGEPVSDDDRAALRKVANACGGHPLALDLLRGKLAGRVPLASYVDGILSRGLLPRLRFDDGAELSEVAFKAVHEELSAAQERAFRLLGAHPGATFSARTAAAMLDLPEFETTELLDDLQRLRLLSRTGGRYRFHALTRLYVADRGREAGDAGELAAALTRMVVDYHEFAIGRDKVLSGRRRISEQRYAAVPTAHSGPDARGEALRDLAEERPNLLAAVRTAADLAMWEQVWQLCESLHPYYSDRALYGDWLDSHELGVSAAEEIADPAAQARMRWQYGAALFAVHEDSAAAEQFERARALAVAHGDAWGEQSATEWAGFVLERTGSLDAALECFDRSKAIVSERFAAQRRRRPLALHGMHAGRVLVRLGRFAEAQELLRDAAEVFEDLGEPGNVAKVLLPLAQAQLRTAEPAAALEQARLALDSFVRLRIPDWRVDALELLGEIHERLGDREAASTCAREAAEVATVLGQQRAQALWDRADQDGPPRS